MKNTEIVIAIRNGCNYHCEYCVGSNAKQDVLYHDLDKVSAIYRHIGPFVVTNFECGSGEPSIHPQIKDLVSICAKYGAVSIPTNNSIDPEKWLPKENPNCLLIRTALHPEGEQDLDGFTQRAQKIKYLGADVMVVFVAHPKRIDKVLDYKIHFSSRDIPIQITAFMGDYEGKHYPDAYTEEEKKLIGFVKGSDWYQRLHAEMVIRDFKNIPCIAGHRFLYIDDQDRLRRCLYDINPIDMPLDHSTPCKVDNCGCRLLLDELNTHKAPFWNQFRRICGYPLMEEDGKSHEELYTEYSAIYWDLMKRYNKK